MNIIKEKGMKDMKDYTGVAALTIVSKNYISLARVLAESFLKNHPGARFFVVLVDKNDGYIKQEEEAFELFDMADVDLPNPDVFPYQYNILELNTAVKPFALRWLLETQEGIEKIAYIDPDIMVMSPLEEVWGGLDDYSVTITPHMREPFNDGHSPSELNILQSGTYNLGFIGLKNDAEGRKLLDWWSERLYLNCVVDISRGLFTDQKWIDLVPGYFPNTKIIHNPAYNIAYWNLHERELRLEDGNYYVEDDTLRFFHFSGYDPRNKDVLSKHQSRHDFIDLPVVKSLYDEYADKLFSADIVETKKWPFAYSHLPNDVKLNDAIHRVVRKCLEDNIPFPSPTNDANAFSAFLCTPNRKIFGDNIAPLVTGIRKIRPDVASAFPTSGVDKNTPDFLAWLNANGVSEIGLEKLISDYGHLLIKDNPVARLAGIYFDREDVQGVYPAAFQTKEHLEMVINKWFKTSAVNEYEDVELKDIERLIPAIPGIYKVLALYAGRLDLQKVFNDIQTHEGINNFTDWLLGNTKELKNINEDEIYMFSSWAKFNGAPLQKFSLIYNTVLRDLVGGIPTIFNVDKICNALFVHKMPYHEHEISAWLEGSHDWTILEQLIAFASQSPELREKITLPLPSRVELLDVMTEKPVMDICSRYSLTKRLNSALEAYTSEEKIINVAGYFHAATGMGQSARSMEHTVDLSEYTCSKYVLPELFVDESLISNMPDNGFLFGLPSPIALKSIVIVNADAVPSVQSLIPRELSLGNKIGYWVWETEELPVRWAHSADYYDEIWSASEYSAKAIEKTIQQEVKVVPHVINKADLPKKKGDRKKFNLPAKEFLVGYFFDQKSINERKNPKGVIDAFRLAFKDEKKAALVLKVNTPSSGEYEYARLKSYASDLNIIWIEETFNREMTLELMSCLDCYISLHRSEGFGLTMAEAMTLGVPVVATGYSGNVEFMNPENSSLVDFKVIKTKKVFGAYPSGTFWAEPCIDSAAAFLLNLNDNHSKFSLSTLIPKKSPKTKLRLLEKATLSIECGEFND
jgi:glycosyltransferase involved in cell wall biosynthesis